MPSSVQGENFPNAEVRRLFDSCGDLGIDAPLLIESSERLEKSPRSADERRDQIMSSVKRFQSSRMAF